MYLGRSLYFIGVLLLFCNGEPELNLQQGVVKGYMKTSYKGRNFVAFEGIPYAEPPIGELRFAPPKPAGKWEGVLEANKQYTCAQLIPIPFLWGPSGTEDCLYVYVYVPGENIDANANLPVVVHIHGGAFMLGSPKMMAQPEYIMDQDVVYVTLNYRLGILGFLSTEDGVVPGNMGLKDQSLALKWIKENIKNFGGNPDSITITGLSAGGASVHYHYLSPMSEGLFSRGFSQSGTALQSWALTKNPLEKAMFVARNVSCETDSTEKMIACMRSKSHKDLIIGIDGLFVLISAMPSTPFGPVVEKGGDSPFIADHPYKILKDGKVYDVPWINTNVADEGIFPVGFFIHLKKIDFIAENWETIMPSALDMNDTVDDSLKSEVVGKIKQFYYKDQPVSEDNIENMVKIYSDRLFFVDSELATRTHSSAVKSPVFVYFYRYLPQDNLRFRKMKPGVSHGLDGKLIFKWMINADLKPKDEKMMKLLTKFLKDFAETGVPKIGEVDWDPVEPGSEEMKYLEVNSVEDVQMKTRTVLGEKEFWNSLPIQENNHIYK
ncbi:venom carboxylesterase-6-like [Coccinella septempunctata]|uniref:venom carboxylesterase-6-like n=1 Tax=Coccinella septempunctata TaxID=41139 RepID=UPI001D0859B2|nr:venom carboxylesterase-6-like [Coccinella septempunctata]